MLIGSPQVCGFSGKLLYDWTLQAELLSDWFLSSKMPSDWFSQNGCQPIGLDYGVLKMQVYLLSCIIKWKSYSTHELSVGPKRSLITENRKIFSFLPRFHDTGSQSWEI